MNIVWSNFSNREYLKALTYVHDEFGLTAATDLKDSVDTWTKRLQDNPEVGAPEPLLADEQIPYRSIKVGKYNKIVYYIASETIRISDFWDMRREPSKIKARVKHS